MSRFNDVVYNADSNTADVGAGLVWDDVYAALEPYGVNVVGGRVSGVGMAGFTLGGGASIPAVCLHTSVGRMVPSAHPWWMYEVESHQDTHAALP